MATCLGIFSAQARLYFPFTERAIGAEIQCLRIFPVIESIGFAVVRDIDIILAVGKCVVADIMNEARLPAE